MITITRRHARTLRAVFRRSTLGIAHRGPIPPLVLRADGNQVRAQHRYAMLAVEHVELGSHRPDEAIALPLEALADLEGRDDSVVVLEAIRPDLTVARFIDHGIPRTHEYTVTAMDALVPFPVLPASWTSGPPELLTALAEASETGADDSTRYALNCLQLRGEGGEGEVAATDGRQMLIRGGLRFPWEGSLLIRRSPIFSCRELPHGQPISVGRTETHVVLRVGAWRLFLEIRTEGRFPVLGDIIPDSRSVVTRLCLDPDDAKFLTSTLNRLPGDDALEAAATLDLNGKVAVRARGSEQDRPTELVLTRSRYTGQPVRLNVNRAFLARAVRLGLRTLEITDPESPVVCRDGRRTYAFQPLNHESAIEPSEDVIRVESAAPIPRPSLRSDTNHEGESPVKPRTTPTTQPPRNSSTPHDPPAGAANNGGGGLAGLIREAETLHEALAAARSQSQRLVAALRRHRKQTRLMSSTIAALKQLRLQEVSE